MTAPASGRPPTTITAVVVLASLTLGRLRRSRSFLVGGLISLLPVLGAVGASGVSNPTPIRALLLLAAQALSAVLPALFIASSIGEDIEDKTIAYLWARPLARWTVLAGKLAALLPVAIVLVVGGWVLSSMIGAHELPSAASVGGLMVGTLASSLAVAAITLLVPKHGMALSISYLILIDGAVGVLPTSLAALSISHHVRVLSDIGEGDGTITGSLVALAVICAVYGAIALARLRRLEA